MDKYAVLDLHISHGYFTLTQENIRKYKYFKFKKTFWQIVKFILIQDQFSKINPVIQMGYKFIAQALKKRSENYFFLLDFKNSILKET